MHASRRSLIEPATGHRAAPTALATAGMRVCCPKAELPARASYQPGCPFDEDRIHPPRAPKMVGKGSEKPEKQGHGPSVAAHSAGPGPCPKPGQHSGRSGGGHHLSAQRRSSRSDRSRGNVSNLHNQAVVRRVHHCSHGLVGRELSAPPTSELQRWGQRRPSADLRPVGDRRSSAAVQSQH